MTGFQENNRRRFHEKLCAALGEFNLDDSVMACMYALRSHCITRNEFFEYLWFLEKYFI